MNNLFVYGTLIFEDESPSHGLNAPKYILKSEMAYVKGRLYAVEGFPFLVLNGNNKVKGKLFRCEEIEPLLEKYDRIEGANQVEPFFERKVIEVELEDGTKENAYTYIGGGKLRKAFAKPEYELKSGDWISTFDN
ncbi:MAG: gamma-glutamylcyclotransferase family protein [Thermoplasmatota archaeon]